MLLIFKALNLAESLTLSAARQSGLYVDDDFYAPAAPSKKSDCGDICCLLPYEFCKKNNISQKNAALKLSKNIHLDENFFSDCFVSLSGLICFKLSKKFTLSALCDIISEGKNYGKNLLLSGQTVNILYPKCNSFSRAEFWANALAKIMNLCGASVKTASDGTCVDHIVLLKNNPLIINLKPYIIKIPIGKIKTLNDEYRKICTLPFGQNNNIERFFISTYPPQKTACIDYNTACRLDVSNQFYAVFSAYKICNKLSGEYCGNPQNLLNISYDFVNLLSMFPYTVSTVCHSHNLQILSRYILSVALEFKKFYYNLRPFYQYIEASDDIAPIALAAKTVLENALNLLDISF